MHIDISRKLEKDERSSNKQYSGLTIKYTVNVHERYIISDQFIQRFGN